MIRTAALAIVVLLGAAGCRTVAPMPGAPRHPAEFESLVAAARRDGATSEGESYEARFVPAFQVGLARAMPLCMNTTKGAFEPFRLVLVIAVDGSVSRAVADNTTPLVTCLRDEAAALYYPVPPFAPFHELIDMRSPNQVQFADVGARRAAQRGGAPLFD